jgi:hypothetical protein
VCVLVLLAVATACASQADGHATGLGAGAPSVGSCRVLTASDIQPASNNTPTVSCAKPHTSVVIAVGSFPPSEITNASVRSGKLGDDALRRCTAAWKRTVGGDVTAQHISIVGLAYYLPDQAQLSKGARWYRCDAVIGGSDGMRLRPIPESGVQGMLDGTVSNHLLACRTAPEFDSGQEVPCSHSHVLRAVGTAPLPGSATYPGADALRAASKKGCATVVADWLDGRPDGGDAYQWPDRIGWEVLGDHVATCWTVTTH